MHPTTPQQQREELQKREEARREEKERLHLEEQLRDFDAHSFYEKLTSWTDSPMPQPERRSVNVTPLRQTTVLQQPLPVSRNDLQEIRKISSHSGRLLALLRAIDQKGIECPYVHQQYRETLEKALEKCDRLNEAGSKYLTGKGLIAWFGRLMNKLHLRSARKDIEFFKDRLEALLMMCRHQEFAQDLVKLRQAYSRTPEGGAIPRTSPPRAKPLFQPRTIPPRSSMTGGK